MWNTLAFSSAWWAGFGLCLSLIASIGAQNLFVLRQAVLGRHVRACVAWCVVSDGLLITLGVLGMARVIAGSPTLAHALRLGGVVFLCAYGALAWWRAWTAGAGVPAAAQPGGDHGAAGLPARTGRSGGSARAVLGGLAVITLLNPHVYLDTVLLIGSIGARQEGVLRWVFVAGAASANLLWFATLALAGRRLQRVLAQPRAWRVLDAVTGATMFGLAWWVARSA